MPRIVIQGRASVRAACSASTSIGPTAPIASKPAAPCFKTVRREHSSDVISPVDNGMRLTPVLVLLHILEHRTITTSSSALGRRGPRYQKERIESLSRLNFQHGSPVGNREFHDLVVRLGRGVAETPFVIDQQALHTR